MFAITVDQRRSRTSTDRVPGLLRQLNTLDLTRRFERTAGDEVQGLCAEGAMVVEVIGHLVSDQGWWVGIGVGRVEQPLPHSVRESRGPALIAARAAVERAHREPSGLAVDGEAGGPARDAETLLQVLARLRQARTPEGREAVNMMSNEVTQSKAARELGISAQAMSRRLRVAQWPEDVRVAELAGRLLDAAAAA